MSTWETPWEEIWQAIDALVEQGKVIYVGSSNFAAWHIVQANEAAARRNFLGLVSEQSLYNLAARTIELEVIPASRAYGVGILPWSPLSGGLLGGALAEGQRGPQGRASESPRWWTSTARSSTATRGSAPEPRQQKPANVGIAWLLQRPGVTAPIVGPRTMEQLEDALVAEKLKLTDDTMKKLDAIWPGPGGEAPDAYAW